MRHAIYPEKTGTITADSEDANYPATNLANSIIKKKWKAVASVQTATLTIPISAIASTYGAIAIYGTNATSATITITDDVTAGTPLNADAWTIANGRYWREWTATANACTVSLELTTTETTLEAGVLIAGDLLVMTNPLRNSITRGVKDLSIKNELRSGHYYSKKLDILRKLSWSCLMSRETAFRNLETLYDYYGPNPFAMLITDNQSDDSLWTLFGYFDGPYTVSHDAEDFSHVSISVEEGV
jgi:hypothetical protein